MSAVLLGIYTPGRTPLHRLSATVKLSTLLVCGIALAIIPGWHSAVIAFVISLMIAAISRMRFKILLRSVLGLLIVMTGLGAYLAWQQGWDRAISVVGDLLALALLATVVTATTPVDEVLDAVAHALRPLRHLGVKPDMIALAFSLMLRGIPTTLQIAQETRMAARARGLQRDPRAMLRPMVIRVIGNARTTGDALHARGVGDS